MLNASNDTLHIIVTAAIFFSALTGIAYALGATLNAFGRWMQRRMRGGRMATVRK